MEETHRYGKLEWFFYIVILPLLFTALLSGIILQFLGYDITGKISHAAKQLPVINKMFPEEQAADMANAAASAQPDAAKQVQEAQDKATALDNAKKQLEDDLAKKNTEIDQLKKQVDDLKKQQDPANAANANGTTATAKPDPVQEKAKVYADMSAAKAAAILSQLSVTEVRQILAKMSSDQQAAILEKMDPAIAGKIMSS